MTLNSLLTLCRVTRQPARKGPHHEWDNQEDRRTNPASSGVCFFEPERFVDQCSKHYAFAPHAVRQFTWVARVSALYKQSHRVRLGFLRVEKDPVLGVRRQKVESFDDEIVSKVRGVAAARLDAFDDFGQLER